MLRTPALRGLQAHTDETVVLSVSDASGALRRTADKDVPDNIGIVLA